MQNKTTKNNKYRKQRKHIDNTQQHIDRQLQTKAWQTINTQ